MSFTFTFPTFDQWLLVTLQYGTAQAFHNHYNCWQTWWKLDGTFDTTTTPFDFLVNGMLSKVASLSNAITGGLHGLSGNVVMKTGGLYYAGWTNTPATIIPQSGDFISWQGCYCIRQMGATTPPRYLGRSQLPFAAKSALDGTGRWSTTAQAIFAIWAAEYLSGYSLFGNTLRPMKYSPTYDTWEYITAVDFGSAPGNLYRRRPRPWKTAATSIKRYPLTWGAGHFAWP